ncbi:hypothetical protein BB561_003707 [Smittium simulii]|uniref:Histone acetyltransferase type B catalytic subunit n=1 Tax=Smittium simulii TaxID=133385 RepID=A0A2T9YK44_9FUNG|nr:hypothetical protein BB561_003707 [Smittium simulii]
MTLLNPDDATGWVTNSNQAITIRLFSGEDVMSVEKFLKQNTTNSALSEEECDLDIVEFHPSFTYTVFGELEKIFGYKGLQIYLNYAAGSLMTYLQIFYKNTVNKIETIENVSLKVDEIEEPITKVLSSDLLHSISDFSKAVVSESIDFTPNGKKIHQYTLSNENDCVYEIYENNFSDKEFRKFHQRLQTFVIFFIEGGQFVDDTDEKWTFYTLYKKADYCGKNVYSFVGFCSVYNYFHWPDNIRARISQFLVLPPYQQSGHGSKLYNFIRQSILSNTLIVDLTVEDPNEAFDDMRDKNDIKWMLSAGNIKKLDKPLPFKDLHNLMSASKFCKKQLIRVAELCLLKNLNNKSSKSDNFKEYRIWVKKRLFRQNYDMLIEMEPEERKKKLQDTFDSVYQDYIRILSTI